MTFVVDSSVMFQICLTRSSYDDIVPLNLVAPTLLWPETCSALRAAVWRRDVRPALAEAALTRLRSAPIRRVDDRELLAAAYDISEQLGWAKTYDAEYVALAGAEGCPLITADDRLKRGAERLVKVLGPTELP